MIPDKVLESVSAEISQMSPATQAALKVLIDRIETVAQSSCERAKEQHELLYKIAHMSGRRNAAHIIQLAREGLKDIFERRGPI